MARAAVKAKQAQARAKAQPAKPARGRRKHSGGGNPNQQLFFMKLRRRQKWVFLLLAIVFAVTFAFVGVGSGTNGGLSGLFSGIFGGGGNPVGDAQAEIKKDPAKGYRQLATAYENTGNRTAAITALETYLGLEKKNAAGWSELGGLDQTQATKLATEYQAVQAAAQLANPGQSFLPPGKLGQALSTDPVYQQSSSQATAQESRIYSELTSVSSAALTAFQTAAKLQPRSANAQQQVAQTAQNNGQYAVALKAWKRYIQLYPTSPLRSQIEHLIKQLETALKPAKPAHK